MQGAVHNALMVVHAAMLLVPVDMAMLDNIAKNRYAKKLAKTEADVSGPIDVLVFMDTLEDTVK